MSDFLTALLSTDFPKLAGFFGLSLLVLGIFTGPIGLGQVVVGPIKLGPIRLPARDTTGRVACFVFGFFFVCVLLIQLSWGSILALYTPTVINSVTSTNGDNGPRGLLDIVVSPAYAAGKTYRVTARQRSVTDVSQIFFGKKMDLYIGDVHLKRPNTVLFFNVPPNSATRIESGTGLDEAAIRKLLPPSDVVYSASLRQGQTETFRVNNRNFRLTVDKVVWSLFGDDYMTISINRE